MSEQEREALAQSMTAEIPPLADLPKPDAVVPDGQLGEVFFQSYSPCDFHSVLHSPLDTPTTCVGELHLPSNPHPSPAVVFLPGSGGYVERDRRRNWANWFLERGRAVLFVDHYRPRGIDPDQDYGTSLLAISVFDRIADAYGALKYLLLHPDIENSDIALMGLSLGGATTRFAMDDRMREAYAPKTSGFSRFVDFYGPCTEDLGTTKTNGAGLLSVRGTNDASNDLEAVSAALENYRRLGVPVTEKLYQDAPHGWDATYDPVFLEQTPYLVGCNTRYDANGVPHYGEVALEVAQAGAGRLQKIQSRVGAMGAAANDLRFGYLNGRDETTAAIAETDLDEFLRTPVAAL